MIGVGNDLIASKKSGRDFQNLTDFLKLYLFKRAVIDGGPTVGNVSSGCGGPEFDSL